MVVGWGRCGRTVTQTQNFASWRAVVVESGPAWLDEKSSWPSPPKPPQLRWGPDFHTLRVRDCQRYCVSRTLG